MIEIHPLCTLVTQVHAFIHHNEKASLQCECAYVL